MHDIESIKLQGAELCAKSEQYSKAVEADMRNLILNFENLMKRLDLAYERIDIHNHQQQHQNNGFEETFNRVREESTNLTRRPARSPSEFSMDSSMETLDNELRQKYLKAVAYLRLLDENSTIQEFSDEQSFNQSNYNSSGRESKLKNVDIDFVIQQARNVANNYKDSDPERARRIMLKVEKLEVRISHFLFFSIMCLFLFLIFFIFNN